MNLAPFLAASLIIKIHIVAMLVAVMLSAPQLILRKGTQTHRICGYVWMAAMFMAALTSLGITSTGPLALFGFSPIHILSFVVMVNVPLAIRAARTGQIERHRTAVRSMVLFGVLGAGLFTLAPGRIMHQILLGS